MTARTLETVIREANDQHDGHAPHDHVEGDAECTCGIQFHLWDEWQAHQAAEVARAVRKFLTSDEAVEVASRVITAVEADPGHWEGLTEKGKEALVWGRRSTYRVALAAVLGGDER